MTADAKYFVQAILDVKTPHGKKAANFANSMVASGTRLQKLGPSITRSFFSLSNVLGLAAGAYGIGRLIQGALEANKEIENLNFSVASTLQLFNRNKNILDETTGKIIGQRDAAAMFAANIKEAGAATDKLFRIAATSPASFQEAQSLFQNLLPGLAQVETSMEKTLDFTKQALSVGTLLGGDFSQAGADLRRMLTGQAGMDVRAWAEGLSVSVKRSAKTMGNDYAKLAKLTGDKFTQAFNKLDPQKRYKLMQTALKDMGAATEAAGNTWGGLTSAIKSDAFLLKKAFGETLFGGLKERFKEAVGAGGIANPLSESFKELEKAARVAGFYMAQAGLWIYDKLVQAADYMKDNWETIYENLSRAFDKGIKAAKLFLAVRATQAAGGMAMRGTGGAASGMRKTAALVRGFFVQGQWDAAAGRYRASSGQFVTGASEMGLKIRQLVGLFGGIVPALGLALPVIALLAMAVGGLGVAFAGVAAFFIDNWQAIVTGIANGTVQFRPFINALGTLWAKLVAVGEAILGTSGAATATSKLNTFMMLAANAIHWIIGAFAMFLRAAGLVQLAWNGLQAGLKTIALGFVALVNGILRLVRGAISIIPGTGDAVAKLDSAVDGTSNSIHDIFNSMKQDAKDATQFMDLANVLEAAVDKDGAYGKSLADTMKKVMSAATEGAGSTEGPTVSPSKNINVHSMRVEMDLRNQDPDRIMGAFVRKLEKVTNTPTQANTQEDYGI